MKKNLLKALVIAIASQIALYIPDLIENEIYNKLLDFDKELSDNQEHIILVALSHTFFVITCVTIFYLYNEKKKEKRYSVLIKNIFEIWPHIKNKIPEKNFRNFVFFKKCE